MVAAAATMAPSISGGDTYVKNNCCAGINTSMQHTKNEAEEAAAVSKKNYKILPYSNSLRRNDCIVRGNANPRKFFGELTSLAKIGHF